MPQPALIDALAQSGDFIGALDEFASIAATIARTRAEISALAADDLKGGRLRPAGHELGAIVRDTEAATHSIMNAAETILALHAEPKVSAEIVKIFEACAFQDITGQRVSKVVAALDAIEQRVTRFAAAMGLTSTAATDIGGPGLNGPRTQQADIDALMAAAPGEELLPA